MTSSKCRLRKSAGRFWVTGSPYQIHPRTVATDPNGRLMVVDYTVNADSFVHGRPRVWSERRLSPGNYMDLAPDGKRFVGFPVLEALAQKDLGHVTFLLNFFDYLRQRVPVGSK